MKPRKLTRILAILFAFALIVAACGDDDDDTSATDESQEEPAEEPTEEPAEEPEEEPAEEPEEEPAEEPAEEPSEDMGPMKVGVINANDLFPDYSGGMESAAAYVNAELDGFGGREVDMSVCNIDYGSPDDTQRCANELVAEEVELVLVGLNQFGNHFEILQGNGIPVLIGSPVTVPDYTTPGAYAVLAGGGCPGSLTGMTKWAVEETGARRIAVPYYDIPSGALCFFDNEEKPLDVYRGAVDGATYEMAGAFPEIEYEGIPTPPGGDLTAAATAILDFDPEAIIYSGPAPDCWALVEALKSLGWSNDQVPFLMTTSCFDAGLAEAAGAEAEGMVFVGASGYLNDDPSTLSGEQAEAATTYQTKSIEYGLPEDLLSRNFSIQGFTLVMSAWERAQEIVEGGGDVTGQALSDAFAATSDAPQFGSPNINCAGASPPYLTLCSTDVDVNEWTGSGLSELQSGYNAMDLLGGTEIRTQTAN